MRGWLAAVALCAGCYRGAAESGDCTVSCASAPCPGDLVCGAHQLCRAQTSQECGAAPSLDAAVDAPAQLDGPPGTTCYGDGLLHVCVFPQTNDITYAAAITLDTTGCTTLATDARGSACVFAYRNLTITGYITATGPYALLLLATQSLTIANTGVLDAASHSNTTDTIGAGSRAACGWTMGDGNGNSAAGGKGSSGGAGGSFGASGGSGGDSAGYLGGSPGPMDSLAPIGGCPGSSGGVSGGAAGPLGGAGGGAVYLIAGGTLSISGTINASGGGGHRAGSGNGGAGGGSGGFIGLDAKIYSATSATVYAVGGGGGCGGDGTTAGSQGYEALGPMATAPCDDQTSGGLGGIGGAGGVAAGDSGTSGIVGMADGGGGGGGGGGGMIAVANLAQFPAGVTTIQPNPVAMP